MAERHVRPSDLPSWQSPSTQLIVCLVTENKIKNQAASTRLCRVHAVLRRGLRPPLVTFHTRD